MAFKFLDVVTMDKTLNWLTFRDYVSIFKVTGGHYVSKLTFFARCFLKVFANNGFQILRYGDHELHLELLTFHDWVNFQGHRLSTVNGITVENRYFDASKKKL